MLKAVAKARRSKPWFWLEVESLAEFLAKAGGFVVQRDEPGGAQDRLAKPAQAEEQEHRPDDELEEMQGDAGEGAAEDEDDGGEDRDGGGYSEERGAPAAGGAYGEDDGEGFDAFDERGEEGGCRGGPEMGGGWGHLEVGCCGGLTRPMSQRRDMGHPELW